MINKIVVCAVLGTAAMPAAVSAAQPIANDPAWYAGGGIGRSDVKRSNSWANQTDALLRANSGITSSTLIESHDTAWKLFGGYQFNDIVAVEVGYHDLGKLKGVTTITAPAPGTAAGTWEASALSVSAVATYGITDRFGFLIKGGLAATRLKANVSSPAPFSANETRVQPVLGVGVKFDFTKAIGVRAEFERFNNIGDGATTGQSPFQVWSVSGLYRF
jgi:OmpA-OmpF porin, OOP family